MAPAMIYKGVDLCNTPTDFLYLHFCCIFGNAVKLNNTFLAWIAVERKRTDNPTFVDMEYMRQLGPGPAFVTIPPVTRGMEATTALLIDKQKSLFAFYAKKLELLIAMTRLAIRAITGEQLAESSWLSRTLLIQRTVPTRIETSQDVRK